MTVKMVFFKHNRENLSLEKLEKLKKTHMYDSFENFPEELQKLFYRLGKIAFKGIEEGRLLFELSEVSGLEECGLLHKLPDVQSKRSLNDPPKSQFCFTHLTVQEFFAAKHLVDTKTDKGIQEFVCNYINDGTWQVVLQFVAGLLNSSLSSNIFTKLLPKSTEKKGNDESSEPETLTSWPTTREDKYLAVQVCKCLYEIKDDQQPVLQNKIEEIKFNAVEFNSVSLAPIDVAAVLHFLENAEDVVSINLSDNEFQDLGAKEVEKFIVNRERKLQQLNLGKNNLTDSAATDFAVALKDSNNCKLESLNLSYNNLTDKAAKDFGAALKLSNCKLKSLDLSYNQFTDKAAGDLAEALRHSTCNLQSLHLCFNKFTDKAGKDLASAIKDNNCKLELLNLIMNNFTKRGRQYLADTGKKSNCKVLS